MPETPWLTVPQAAERVQVSNKMIYLAVARKDLHSVRIGTSIRIHQDWLDAWLNQEIPDAVPFRRRDAL